MTFPLATVSLLDIWAGEPAKYWITASTQRRRGSAGLGETQTDRTESGEFGVEVVAGAGVDGAG
ncbi:hypothetical protein ACSVDM_03270, partial [Nocardia sp. JW2]|uniref:hypothetical protein n=1 Tax=Nocardia sp. JW2 TaxID=3450738 RepID=UPI003F4415AF